ncbi:MAG: AMP-dependent synthetase [Promethearchaeota archaeon]|nr:MAG: AMP-dependent synthetase [Candidatus Lokiarchaeota archaeon]
MSSERFWTKSYDAHVPKSIDYKIEDFGTMLTNAMERFPDKVGIYFYESEYSYKEVLEKSRKFATFLQKQGLKKGDVVAMNIPNCPQYLFALFGTYIAGGVSSGLSPLLSDVEMQYQLDDSDAKFIVTLDVIYEKVLSKILDKLPKLKVIIPTNISEFMGFPKIKVALGKLLKKIPKGKMDPWPGKTVVPFLEAMETPIDLKKVKIDPKNDLMLIQYTGGTTGRPKGVEITHANLCVNMQQFDIWLDRTKGHDVTISAFPYFHLAGLFVCLFLTYISSSHIIIANPRDTDHLIKEIIEKKPTIFANVPTLFLMLQRNPKSKKIPDETLDNIELWFSGAAPFPAEAVKDFEKDFRSKDKFIEVYGMTESAVLVTVNPRYGEKKIGTVGLPFPDTDVKLVDVETGKDVSEIGKAGEICLKGPQITKRYYKKPEQTAQTYVDGWLHTGDVGIFDEEGYLTIVDRTKDMISVSGFKVYSVHVEDVITKHPAIQLMAIIGVPDPDRPGSEIVKAIIQLKEGIDASETVKNDIKKYAEKNLAKYEVPKIWEIREEMPLTAVGKVMKKVLREEENK